MISGSLCENRSFPALQTAADSLQPPGQLHPAPATAALTWQRSDPCTVTGEESQEGLQGSPLSCTGTFVQSVLTQDKV